MIVPMKWERKKRTSFSCQIMQSFQIKHTISLVNTFVKLFLNFRQIAATYVYFSVHIA